MSKVNTGFRLEPDTIARVDALAALMSQRAGGIAVKPSEAARAALTRGLDVLMAELTPKEDKPAAKPRK